MILGTIFSIGCGVLMPGMKFDHFKNIFFIPNLQLQKIN